MMKKEAKAVRALAPLFRLYPWALPAIVVLGMLASLAEGLGISLFIPFLRSLEQSGLQTGTGNWLVDTLGDLFVGVPPDQRLLVISVCIFGSMLVKACLTYSHTVLFGWMNVRIGHRLRSRVFEQLLAVSYRFLERNSSGELLNTLSQETWRTSDALSALVQFIIAACTLGVYAALLLLIDWKLTLLVAGAMLVIMGTVRLMTRRVNRLGQQVTRANATLSHRMVEGLAGMRVIRAFSRERYEQKRFEENSRRLSEVMLNLRVIADAVTPLYEVLAAALLVSVLFFTLQNPENLAALLVFIFVLYRLQPKVMELDNARVELDSLAAAVEDVTALLDRSDKPYIRSGEALHDALEEAIRFDRVTFRYDPSDRPALRDVSLRIPAGRTTALVGPSGAGKSTLIKLIFRFYDATEGTVYADDRPLCEMELSSWRRQIALVSQDTYIFNATVRENIAYGRLDASEEDLEAAARHADAHTFITQLADGYDTKVGDRGVRLSGGQRQRIALARAIVRDPQLLILDEATSELDSFSESAIQKALAMLRRERTVIVIAHRLSTVEQVDQIVVLDDGHVREQGTLEQLLERGGLFTRLYDLQNRRLEEPCL